MECMFIFRQRIFKSSSRLKIQSFLEKFDCLARLQQNLTITEKYFSNIIKETPFCWQVKLEHVETALLATSFMKNETDKKILSLSFGVFFY